MGFEIAAQRRQGADVAEEVVQVPVEVDAEGWRFQLIERERDGLVLRTYQAALWGPIGADDVVIEVSSMRSMSGVILQSV